MFPYIKLSLDKKRTIWIRYDIITEVYAGTEGKTEIATSIVDERDFGVLESVDEVIGKLRACYCPEDTMKKPSAIISDSARPSYDNAPSSICSDLFSKDW